MKERHDLDCFSFIRLINYLRKEKPLPELIMSEKSDKLWKKDDYLKPVDSNDPMLMYDIEEDEQGNLLKGNDKKSDNLQYNTLGCWVDRTNDSWTKRLMFQALFFFINFYRLKALKTLFFTSCKVIKK